MDTSGVNAVVEPTVGEVKLTPAARYYRLHAEVENERAKAYYHARPDVIAKREERERIRAEKAAAKAAAKDEEKERKRQEKERKRQERLALAIATSKKPKGELKELVGAATLDEFLRHSEKTE
jgi:hypothetical protein